MLSYVLASRINVKKGAKRMVSVTVMLAIMLVSSYLIHCLTECFGFELKYSSLLLCAFLACLVTGTTIFFSPFLTQSHYLLLAVLIMLSGCAVTAFNENLLQKSALSALGDAPLITQKSPAPMELSHTEKEMPPEANAVKDEPLAEPALPQSAQTEKKVAEERLPVPLTNRTADDTVQSDTEPEKSPPSPVIVLPSGLEVLDDYLDYAFTAQEEGNALHAICAYKTAIDNYANDPYAPFLFIELGNLYKEQADYAACLTAYEKALTLPVIADNDASREQFQQNLSYLRAVYHILEQHDALQTPFSQLPQDFLTEAEEFERLQTAS